MLLEAARINDPIEHSKGWLAGALGALAGLVVGALLVAAIVIFAPAAAAIIGTIGLLSLGLGMVSLGKELGDKFFKKTFEAEREVVGDIEQGSPDTTIGSVRKKAARLTDKLGCHRGKVLAMGVKDITINRLPAACKDDETQCKGKVLKGCTTVLYGGPSVTFPDVVKIDENEAIPDLLFFTYEVLDVANLVLSVISLRGMLKPGGLAGATRFIRGWKMFDVGHSATDLVAGQGMKIAEGGYAELWGRATDNYRYSATQQAAEFTRSETYQNAKFGWMLFGTAKSLGGIQVARMEAAAAVPTTTGGSPSTTRIDPTPSTPDAIPTTTRVEAPPATPPTELPTTMRVGDPPGWDDTAAAIQRELRGEVELPAWHDRMAGSRGE